MGLYVECNVRAAAECGKVPRTEKHHPDRGMLHSQGNVRAGIKVKKCHHYCLCSYGVCGPAAFVWGDSGNLHVLDWDCSDFGQFVAWRFGKSFRIGFRRQEWEFFLLHQRW
eukprot:Lithocolla_globosa_v1_NODE_4083_length_1515_cov_18.275342.p2 type:complete len:111 gc:universal NODE_4083_length_1515_cov_18.275342:1299-967(-)